MDSWGKSGFSGVPFCVAVKKKKNYVNKRADVVDWFQTLSYQQCFKQNQTNKYRGNVVFFSKEIQASSCIGLY